MATQNIIQVRTTFLGFAQPAIIETVTTTSNPASPRWTATSYLVKQLRAARRPKQPSLKEQAKAELNRLIALVSTEGALSMAEPIRCALEQLDALP